MRFSRCQKRTHNQVTSEIHCRDTLENKESPGEWECLPGYTVTPVTGLMWGLIRCRLLQGQGSDSAGTRLFSVRLLIFLSHQETPCASPLRDFHAHGACFLTSLWTPLHPSCCLQLCFPLKLSRTENLIGSAILSRKEHNQCQPFRLDLPTSLWPLWGRKCNS